MVALTNKWSPRATWRLPIFTPGFDHPHMWFISQTNFLTYFILLPTIVRLAAVLYICSNTKHKEENNFVSDHIECCICWLQKTADGQVESATNLQILVA
jgi:hypothetical protein